MELGLDGGPISLILKYVLQNCMEGRIDNKTSSNVQDKDFQDCMTRQSSTMLRLGPSSALVGMQSIPLNLHYV